MFRSFSIFDSFSLTLQIFAYNRSKLSPTTHQASAMGFTSDPSKQMGNDEKHDVASQEHVSVLMDASLEPYGPPGESRRVRQWLLPR